MPVDTYKIINLGKTWRFLKKKKKEQLDYNVLKCELCQVLKGQYDKCQMIDIPDSESWGLRAPIIPMS